MKKSRSGICQKCSLFNVLTAPDWGWISIKNLILYKLDNSYAKDYVMINEPMSAAAKYKVTCCIYHFFLVGCKNGDAQQSFMLQNSAGSGGASWFLYSWIEHTYHSGIVPDPNSVGRSQL